MTGNSFSVQKSAQESYVAITLPRFTFGSGCGGSDASLLKEVIIELELELLKSIEKKQHFCGAA